MSYTKQTWSDLPNTTTPINATRLNHMEDGIGDALTDDNIKNTTTSSITDTYSCDYINGIIESDSNANGYYTKYADGTLICRGSVGPITTNANAGTTTPVTFPYEFVDTNWQIQLTMTNGQAFWSYVFANAKDKTKTGFGLDTWNNSGGTNSGQYFDYIAIGKWK